MPAFKKNNSTRTPFGVNVWRKSVRDVKTSSYTFYQDGIPYIDVDGELQKVLQPGTIIAKITSGPGAGMVGVFQAGGTDEVQTLTKSGTISGGTWDMTIFGVLIEDIAWDVTASTLQTTIRDAIADAYEAGNVTEAEAEIADGLTVTGGPIASTPFTITYNGEYGANVAQITVDVTGLTGSTPGITPATGTPGVEGATDGRQTTANIVGINDTFLPWQLLERDVEIAVAFEAAAVQAWCIEYNASGAPIPLSNTTRDAIVARADLAILFPPDPIAVES